MKDALLQILAWFIVGALACIVMCACAAAYPLRLLIELGERLGERR